MAQLPSISENSNQLPITEEYFIELCSRFLDSKTISVLKSLSLEPPIQPNSTGIPLLDGWYEKERSLRIALAQIRSLKMKKSFSNNSVISPEIMQTARTATGFDSPLEAEQYLNTARLQFLNDLGSLDVFSTDSLFAYALKLKLVCRMNFFREETGMQSYRKIYDQILGEKI